MSDKIINDDNMIVDEVKEEDNAYQFIVSPHTSYNTGFNWFINQLTLTKSNIELALNDPYSAYERLQLYSYRISGFSTFYNNYLEYLTNTCTFDYMLYPTKENVDLNEYERLAKDVAKYGVKSFPRTLIYYTLKYGESYWCPVTSSSVGQGNKTMYQSIPNKYCKTHEKDNYGVFRFKVNVAIITPEDLKYMPLEIKNAVRALKGSESNEKELWYTVKNGFAMLAHLEIREHDYPYLSHIFTDLISYEENKDYYDEYMKEDAVKMVHNKVPLNKENDKPILGKEITRAYHEETKKHVPKNVSVSTNPFETTALTFDKNSQIQANIVEQSKRNIEDGSGISSGIFNLDKPSGQILEKSLQKDANNMIRFLPEIQNIFNWLFRGKHCMVSYVDSTNFNKSSKIDTFGKNLNNGGSRLQYVAYTGLEPYEFLSLSKLESAIGIDKLMPPKAMSAQLSSDDAGAPTLPDEELDDEGETAREKA